MSFRYLYGLVTAGAYGVVDAGLVPPCVEKLVQEDSTELKVRILICTLYSAVIASFHVLTQEVILGTLHWCFQVDTAQGLQCGAIPSSLPLLSHPSASVRGRAATLLYDLTTPYSGKEEACKHKECVEALVKLLQDEDSFVRSQTTAALMRCVLRDTMSRGMTLRMCTHTLCPVLQ